MGSKESLATCVVGAARVAETLVKTSWSATAGLLSTAAPVVGVVWKGGLVRLVGGVSSILLGPEAIIAGDCGGC